jgi:hypothetical protein
MAINSNHNKTTKDLLNGNSGGANATYGSYISSGAATEQTSATAGASGQKQTMEYLVGRDEPVAQNLPLQAGQDAQRVNFSAGTNTASGATGTGAATEQKAYAGAWAGSEPIDSYEEFLRNKESAYGSMRDEQTQFYDEQSQKALAAIEAQRQAALAEAQNQKNMADTAATEQKNAALAEAENQKNLLITMSEEQKNAVYKFAEEQRISDMNYAAQQYQLLLDSINAQRESGMAMATEQRDLLLSMSEEQRQAAYKHAEEQRASATEYANSQYQTLVDAINAQKESGMAMAEEQRQLLLSMSEEQRNAIYAAAESQRVAAEQRADVERERGVVDARSSYEQNKASYGANAEAMGSMGLSGSGYSDYLNSKAYAQQRAETQAANAQADASKREARYTEDQARLKADSDYYQNKYNAEQAYSDRKYQIDTTYQTNMLNAEQNKAQSIYEAESAERDAKYSADSAHTQNEYSAEAKYSQNKYEVDTTYQNNLLGANQSKAQAEHEATSAESESKFNADQAHAQNKYAAESGYSQSKYEAESAERDAKLQSGLSYSENLFNAESQARSDKLAAEQTADAGKFNAEMSYQQNLLNNDDAIGKHRLEQEQKAEAEDKQAAALNEAKKDQATRDFASILEAVNSGKYTTDQALQLGRDLGLSEEQLSTISDAAASYESAQKDAADAEHNEIVDGIKDQVTSSTTNEAIDELVDEGILSAEEAEEMKKDRNAQLSSELDKYLANGDIETFEKTIETAYSEGRITNAEYKAKYFSAVYQSIDGIESPEEFDTVVQNLDTLMSSGKLEPSQYNQAREKLIHKMGAVPAAGAAEVEFVGRNYVNVTFNGKTYNLQNLSGKLDPVDKNISDLLDIAVNGERQAGRVVMLNGKLYGAYGTDTASSKWVELPTLNGNDILSAFSKAFSAKGQYDPNRSDDPTENLPPQLRDPNPDLQKGDGGTTSTGTGSGAAAGVIAGAGTAAGGNKRPPNYKDILGLH